MGEREIRATAAISGRFTDRPMREIESILSDGAPLARHIREIRALAEDLSRLGSDSERSDIKRFAQRIGERQEEIRELAQELEDDLVTISADNAQLAQEAKALHLQIRMLDRFSVLLARLDDELTDQAADTDLLLVVRQRHRDLLMQLAVATQAHAAVQRLEASNTAVLRAMRQAATLVLTALHASGLAVHAIEAEGAIVSALDAARLHDSLDDVEKERRASLSAIKHGGRQRG